MKTNSTYKMPKWMKNTIASVRDPHKRGEIKRSLIQAQLMGNTKVKTAKEERKGHKTAAAAE